MPVTTAASSFSRRGRRSTLSGASSMRPEVAPPSLRCAPDGVWQRLAFWLMAPSPQEAAPPPGRLQPVRTGFLATLADIEGEDADQLRGRIEVAQTLRELWHLRAELYRVVGVALSQGHAEQRLAQLNPHFAARSPRSQLVAL